MSVRLLESQRVPRKGLAVDDFAKERSIDDALALLAVPGHTRHEFLNSRVHTRLYLDYDEVLETPLTPEILKDRKEKVVAMLDALLGPFVAENTQVSYSIASRHGFSPRHGKFKVSFRPFVRGLSIPYTEIPRLLRSTQTSDLPSFQDFWDMSIYKDGEQLLAAINGIKDRDDPRVLTKEHADDPDAWYVAQILDDDALPFRMPVEESQRPESQRRESQRRESNVDIVLVRDVLTCLSSDRFRDYESWRTVGFALKSLGDSTRDYAGLFQEFSRIPEYDSTEAQGACRELFERASTNGVTFGTLRHWAKEDDAAGYERACAAYKQREVTSHVKRVPDDKIMDAARILYTKLTFRPAPIASVLRHDVTKAVFDVHVLLDDVTEGHLTMALDTLHVRGVFHGETFEKYLNDSEATAIPVVGVEIASVHKDLLPDLQWRIMRPTGTRAVFSTENNGAMIEVLNVNSPGKETANVKFDLKTAAIKKGQMSLLNDAYKKAIQNSVVNDMNMGWAINIAINGTVNIYNGQPEEKESAFDILRPIFLNRAQEQRLRKLDGIIYRPVPHCPCAYVSLSTYADFINDSLSGHAVYVSNPKRFEEAMKYLTNYRDDKLPLLVRDTHLLSFSNGVLNIQTREFIEYSLISGDSSGQLSGKVARHHIDARYSGTTDTPLLDIILDAQFGKEVAEVLCALFGRAMFRVRELDNWEVMPYIVGVGGTGKSLLLNVLQHMFAPEAVGSLAAKREVIFGMANLVDKEVVIGRDMPAKLSESLPQEIMQCMTTGEQMEIPRKTTTALHVPWSAPVVMASNHMPDYLNTGNNVGRRLVALCFNNVVANPQEDLQSAILAGELPSIIARSLASYGNLRARVKAAGSFWKAMPPEVLEWRGKLSAATNTLYEFLAMEDDERTSPSTFKTYSISNVPGHVTWVSDLKHAFEDCMSSKLLLDAATLGTFGYRASGGREHVCKSCKGIAKARGGRCCDAYDVKNRIKKEVIFDMRIVTM
ncbi:hypothetical protein TSOC_005112 [Tetrabaena socialis]|uniref:SF3 helicase domain-containing protein n=1 Tax=Tetrabaena socialis TaxID=47790 RepID=A0A2J8A7C4_9CHLO|nr:hypothetical protein TSOC_005112 [Tetrabaena socialis]|eukprot:PNH08373.1 hypothetical protein TSOC_005112 [Tetrabaena socialis]